MQDRTDKNYHQELFVAAQTWADKHIEETGHTVWLHRRKFDVAVACFTCIENSKNCGEVGTPSVQETQETEPLEKEKPHGPST